MISKKCSSQRKRSVRSVTCIAVLVGVAGCGGDTSGITTFASSASGDDTSGGTTGSSATTAPPTTTISGTLSGSSGDTSSGPDTDPAETDSNADTESSSTTDPSTTGPSTTDASSGSSSESGSTGVDSCGDNIIDGDDVCDGTDLNSADCVSEGFDAGTLACTEDCLGYDTSGCTSATCNGIALKGDEVCDGAFLAGQDCASQGFDDGVLACAANCMAFDTSGCNMCGDNDAAGTEVCDGTDVPGTSCVAQGFESGTIGCLANCSAIDTTPCVPFMCGDNSAGGTEVCDGTDLNGADCVSQGLFNGSLACAPGCGSFDTSSCLTYACEDEAIGSPVGIAVATGNTAADDGSINFSCALVASPDHVMSYTAAVAGVYTFDTIGSPLDTVLSVSSGCGTELACEDDISFALNRQSSVSVSLAANQTVLVAIAGFNTDVGLWQLNVHRGQAVSVNAGGLPLAVPDGAYNGTLASMACANLPVAANGFNTVSDVDLQLGINSTWVGDLTVKVVSPSGTVITAMSRPGEAEAADNGTEVGAGFDADVVAADVLRFRDPGLTNAEALGASGNAVCSAAGDGLCDYFGNPGAAVAGTFGLLAGETAVGTWRVCVGDGFTDDLASIGSARLNIIKSQ